MNMFAKEILFFLILLPLFADAIIGGEYVTNPHKYPWMVNIESFSDVKPSSSCGGAIISENMILTAAHCVEHGWFEFMYFRKLYGEYVDVAAVVRIGHSSLNHALTVKVKSKLIHPNYFASPGTRNENQTYDIALLELSEDLKFNKEIQPIALPDVDFNETNYLDKLISKFMVAGWGFTFDIPNDFYPLVKSNKWTVHKSKIPKEKYLKYCKDPKSVNATCEKSYNKNGLIYCQNQESWICEDDLKLTTPTTLKETEVNYIKFGNNSSNNEKELWWKDPLLIQAMSTKPYIPGTCHGDSGGPLMKLDVTSGKYELVGIVSSFSFDVTLELQGPRGCLGTMPAVYTRVSEFIPWIKESMTKAFNPDLFMQLNWSSWN